MRFLVFELHDNVDHHVKNANFCSVIKGGYKGPVSYVRTIEYTNSLHIVGFRVLCAAIV